VLGYYDPNEGASGSLFIRCKDADEANASLIHPTEVAEWDCVNDDLDVITRYDVVETTCNCPTTPSSSCSDGDSFYLDVLGYSWDGLSTFDGCYMDSGATFNSLPQYFPDGEKVEGPAVYATELYGTPVS